MQSFNKCQPVAVREDISGAEERGQMRDVKWEKTVDRDRNGFQPDWKSNWATMCDVYDLGMQCNFQNITETSVSA